jgi:hypothetical protein
MLLFYQVWAVSEITDIMADAAEVDWLDATGLMAVSNFCTN